MKATRKSAVNWAGASAVAVLLATTSAFADAPRNDGNRNGGNDRATQAQAQSNLRGTSDQRANQQRASDQNQRDVDSRSSAYEQGRNRNDSRATTVSNRDERSYENQSRGRVQQDSRYRDNQRVNVSGRITSFRRERDGYRVQLDRNNDNYWVPASRLGNRARDLRVGISISLGGIFRGGTIGIDAVSWPDNGGYGTYGDSQGYLRGVIQRVDYRSGILTLRDEASGRVVDVDMRDTARNSRIDLNDVRRGDYVTLSGQWVRNNAFAAYSIDSLNTGR